MTRKPIMVCHFCAFKHTARHYIEQVEHEDQTVWCCKNRNACESRARKRKEARPSIDELLALKAQGEQVGWESYDKREQFKAMTIAWLQSPDRDPVKDGWLARWGHAWKEYLREEELERLPGAQQAARDRWNAMLTRQRVEAARRKAGEIVDARIKEWEMAQRPTVNETFIAAGEVLRHLRSLHSFTVGYRGGWLVFKSSRLNELQDQVHYLFIMHGWVENKAKAEELKHVRDRLLAVYELPLDWRFDSRLIVPDPWGEFRERIATMIPGSPRTEPDIPLAKKLDQLPPKPNELDLPYRKKRPDKQLPGARKGYPWDRK